MCYTCFMEIVDGGSYEEQREYDTIEQVIENLEQELNLIQTEMEQCGSDYVKLQTLTDRQQETSARLEERMERWAELTEMAETMQKHGGNQ